MCWTNLLPHRLYHGTTSLLVDKAPVFGPASRATTTEVQDLYSHWGRVEVNNWFRDDSQEGGGRTEARVFTRLEVRASLSASSLCNPQVESYLTAWKSGAPRDTYPGGSALVDRAAREVTSLLACAC